MMNYKKGKNVEEELTKDKIPFECLPDDFLWMHVKGGTQVSNVVNFAKNALDKGEHRSIVWSGSGGGITKTISCAEILKRSYQLHQVTRLCYRKVEEYWDPITEGLEQIVASRQIPSIHILMSIDEINQKSLGYQDPSGKTKFWDDSNKSDNKKASGSGNSSRYGQNYGNKKPKTINKQRFSGKNVQSNLEHAKKPTRDQN